MQCWCAQPLWRIRWRVSAPAAFTLGWSRGGCALLVVGNRPKRCCDSIIVAAVTTDAEPCAQPVHRACCTICERSCASVSAVRIRCERDGTSLSGGGACRTVRSAGRCAQACASDGLVTAPALVGCIATPALTEHANEGETAKGCAPACVKEVERCGESLVAVAEGLEHSTRQRQQS